MFTKRNTVLKPDRERMDIGIGSLNPSTNKKMEVSLTATAGVGSMTVEGKSSNNEMVVLSIRGNACYAETI